jgi:hypothetical protein
MKISRDDLKWAADHGHLRPGQDAALWAALETRFADRPRFDAANVAYYAGALLVLGGMGWFITLAWESLPPAVLTGIAVTYAIGFIIAGRWVWDSLRLRVPGGLLFTMAVGMAPLATYGLLKQFDLWPEGSPGNYRGFHFKIHGSWIALEFATMAAGAIALRFRRFPFLTAPIAVAAWYLSMDIAMILLGQGQEYWQGREWVSVFFGLATLVFAYYLDLRSRHEDFAFWIYLFGLLSFWGGLSFMNSDAEFGKFLYAVINAGLVVIAVALRRPMFAIFGSAGVTGYIGHLSYRVFKDSILFPAAITTLGLCLVAAGVIYHRNRKRIEVATRSLVPDILVGLLPPRARES